MNQIKCPNCGEVFTIDESNYESIVKQVRDHQFNEEIEHRQKEYEEKLNAAVQLAKTQAESDNKDNIFKLEQQISNLQAQLDNKDTESQLATKEALDALQTTLNEKEKQINDLNAQLKNKETESKLLVTEAISKKDKEIMELQASSQALKDSYESKLSAKDETIAYYKDFKARLSTKMIGEDLEQHCLYEFNRVRPLFRNAYFEKDNDSSSGTKGDFIFRDFDDDKTEIVSIMFEMKNEADTTSTKQKNEDFLDKLDEDRKKKNCEYAVLVSLLEMDNDTYNEGIVDVSHRYEKMYVIRPQHFIPIITLLRNANMNSLDYKKQLIIAKNQDIDFKNFENNMLTFKNAFGKNFELASKKYDEAIAGIDKAIRNLQNIKESLESSNRNYRLANDKAQKLTLKKLTKNAPSIAAKISGIEEDE